MLHDFSGQLRRIYCVLSRNMLFFIIKAQLFLKKPQKSSFSIFFAIFELSKKPRGDYPLMIDVESWLQVD